MSVAHSPFDDEKTEIRVDTSNPKQRLTGYPCLELMAGPSGTTRFPLAPGKNSIGRSNENDIVLDDSSVSRKHAVVELGDRGAFVSDLGSRNGTKVGTNKIQQSTIAAHGTKIKVGVYELRYLAHEGQSSVAPSSEPPNPNEAASEPAPFDESPPAASEPSESFNADGAFAPAIVPEIQPQAYQQGVQAAQTKTRAKRSFYFILVIGFVATLLLGGMSTWKFLKGKIFSSKTAKKTEAPVSDKNILPSTPPANIDPPQAPAKPEPLLVDQPVFLDVTSTPVPAKIYFGDQLIGTTPLRLSTNLLPGRWYEARAIFDVVEFAETREEKVKFSIPTDVPTSILPVVFNAKMGTFKVNTLPRDAQLYLEGFFDQDPTKSRSVKLSQVAFGQNIFLPNGRYIVELKKSKQLGGSQTYLDDVVYHREFLLDDTQTSYTLEVKDETLKTFPAEINSQPTGAKIFVDDKEIGVTPLKTELPTGDHSLALRKEGYYDDVQVIHMTVNTPYVTNIVLKTSEAGELINKADAFIKEERFQEALPILVEAFSRNPGPRETAQISYLVGICYLRQKSFKEARDYFNKAMLHDDFKFHGKLGIASVSLEEGDKDRSLQLVVEILTSSEDPRVRSDAGALFQRLSPLNSVLYIATEPAGARVYVNGMEIPQQTPLILHDLGVGNFRIIARKEGYQEAETKMSLGVSEFKPLVMKLTPN